MEFEKFGNFVTPSTSESLEQEILSSELSAFGSLSSGFSEILVHRIILSGCHLRRVRKLRSYTAFNFGSGLFWGPFYPGCRGKTFAAEGNILSKKL